MDYAVGRLISILYRKNQVYLNIVLREYAVTSAESPFLLYLYKRDGISQEDLSAYLVIDKASTARAIQSLTEKGYVYREKDETDKRRNRVYLTDKARSARRGIDRKLRRWSRFLTEDLCPEVSDTVYTALERMVEKVEHTDFRKKWGDKQ
ncbi:MarR family winged helix-turn-helix transcriptional regulator [Breznakiella homolactica]|uniref:Winged helix-turn-helix transcriptional regulator n=1 Tax=Breznakiella homolactica TaxID=2798577 RepID=A0A7T7XNM8_9SPIR|nr:MarR family winged helix-turn-helix transcriptional regulator [Breznakiella homolactica]QQO09638.1 MarR family winged helix-turn-helix transcriptional regulator [Breznakiella homolactica]